MSRHPITDHALLRWLERSLGYDVEGLREEVRQACSGLIRSGASGGWVGPVWAIIEDGRVKTFVQERPSPGQDNRHRRADYPCVVPGPKHWKDQQRKRNHV